MKKHLFACAALALISGTWVWAATPLAEPATEPVTEPTTLPASTTARTTVPTSAWTTTVQDKKKRAKFRKDFNNARQIKAEKEMKSLFNRNTDEAAMWIIELAHSLAVYPSIQDGELFEDLEKTWKAAKRTDFAQEMRLYYGGFEGEDFKNYADLEQKYHKTTAEYFKLKPGEKDTDPAGVVAMGVKFEELAKEFKGIKCEYFASQCWSFVAACADEYYAKDLKDMDRAADAYGECLDARERIGLKDRQHKETLLRYRHLTKAGYGVDGEGSSEGGGSGDDAGAPPSDMTRAEMKFELLDKIDTYERPNYFADEHYSLWHAIWLGEVGSEYTEVLRFGELWKDAGSKMAMRRDGSSKVYLDMDGDQERTEADLDIPVKGKLEPVEIKVDIAGKERFMGFFVQTGQEKDQYQGFEANLQATDSNFAIYASPAGTLVGTIEGETVRIIDEDMNGLYGGAPLSFGHDGLTKGYFHPEFDSVVVGSSKEALPFSTQMKIGKSWVEMVPASDGSGVDYAVITPETGLLKLKFSGPKPAFVILEGLGGLKGTLIDITKGSTVEAPVGEYKLLVGMISKGKKKQLQKVLILPGENTPTWDVQNGLTIEVALGSPFSFDFKADPDPQGVTVIGKSVVVVGKAGERYERPWLCVARPLASARKAGAKKGSKPTKMPAITDTLSGYQPTWFPGDVSIDVKGAEGQLEVQLTEKKHRLFGKISSAWLTAGQ